MTNFYIKAITIGESTNSAQMLHNLVPGRYELRMDEALSLQLHWRARLPHCRPLRPHRHGMFLRLSRLRFLCISLSERCHPCHQRRRGCRSPQMRRLRAVRQGLPPPPDRSRSGKQARFRAVLQPRPRADGQKSLFCGLHRLRHVPAHLRA